MSYEYIYRKPGARGKLVRLIEAAHNINCCYNNSTVEPGKGSTVECHMRWASRLCRNILGKVSTYVLLVISVRVRVSICAISRRCSTGRRAGNAGSRPQ